MGKDIFSLAEIEEVHVEKDVSILDVSNERSVINLVTQTLRESIERTFTKNPGWLNLNERELQIVLKPSDTDDKIRLLFWREYNRCQDRGNSRMVMSNVFGPIMSHESFRLLMETDRRVAWMLKPPEEYMISLEAALNRGKDTMTKIMSMDLFDSRGRLKKTEATIFLKAYEMLDNRVKGAVVQRIEQKTASLHVHQEALPSDDMRKELEELRKKQVDIELIDVKKPE